MFNLHIKILGWVDEVHFMGPDEKVVCGFNVLLHLVTSSYKASKKGRYLTITGTNNY